MDDKQRALNHASSMGITPASENAALLSAINFQASGSQHYQTPSSHSEVCVENVSELGSRVKKVERSATRSTNCSNSKSHFVPIVDFVGRFESSTIKPNEMIKNFKTKFTKINDDETQVYSTVTPEAGSKLNPNFEPYVPNGSLEQVSTSSISGLSDCDVKPFDPKEFHGKVCCYACGRPCHIARHCLHRHTEFFYGKNQKVKPKAKPVAKPMRTDQSFKPRVKPQKVTKDHPTAKKAKIAKQNQSIFPKQRSNVFKSKTKRHWKDKPHLKHRVKPIDHGSGVRPKIDRVKSDKPKGIIKNGPNVPQNFQEM
ncbi:hypothetical protein R6Q57_022608 [Mikania cordata]